MVAAVHPPHPCPCCGRRTYRRRRHVPRLDERCKRCADRGFWTRADAGLSGVPWSGAEQRRRVPTPARPKVEEVPML